MLEGLSIFRDDPLLFKPGERYHYSSHGYSLLGAVVEGASGQDFLGYMQEHVFDPVGMRDTVPDLNDRIILNRSHFYVRDKGGPWQQRAVRRQQLQMGCRRTAVDTGGPRPLRLGHHQRTPAAPRDRPPAHDLTANH